MSNRDVLKFMYWVAMPMAIGFVLFYYLDKMDMSLPKKFLVLLIICLPISMMRVFIGNKIFKEKQTLAEKIMTCGLRRRYGNSYCVDCPDSFTCPTTLDGAK